MGAFSSVEQRFVDPQSGDLDTVLPDATTATARSVIVFNRGTIYNVVVKCQAGQLVNGAASVIVLPAASGLFVSDGTNWRGLMGGSVSLTAYLAGVDQLALESGGNLDTIADNTTAMRADLGDILDVLNEILIATRGH